MTLKEIWKKNRELILYVAFGAGTTAVNFFSFLFFSNRGVSTASSTAIAWLLSVFFAFVTNKFFVFGHKDSRLVAILKEGGTFFLCRAVSGLADIGVMVLFVDMLNCNKLLIKILSNVVVIAVNYIASKFYIFKKR